MTFVIKFIYQNYIGDIHGSAASSVLDPSLTEQFIADQ